MTHHGDRSAESAGAAPSDAAARRPIVVAGSHGQGLLLRVKVIPRQGETVLGTGFEEPEDGGKATNQAVAAAKLGAPVRLVSLVGNDARGRRCRALLARSGIDSRFVREVEGSTDVGFVILPSSGIPAIVTSQDLSLQLDDEAITAAAEAFWDASVVVCQLEAPSGCALTSFRLGHAAGAITVLNPAPAALLEPELIALTDILVPNEHEAAILAGTDEPPRVLASRLSDQYGRAVVVTAGADGCYVDSPELSPVHFPAPDVLAKDTTGAGDAFVGALAVSLRARESLVTAVAFAIRAASISVTRAGTMPSFADRSELLELAGLPTS